MTMNKLLTLSALMLAAGSSMAQDVGRVISSTPVVQQVGVPRQVCSTEQVTVQSQKSGAGAVMGAIAGGAVGNQIGRGGGNAAATVLGLVGGAILGDKIEGSPPDQVQNVQRCTTQTVYENRTVGYNVAYEFGGKQYTVQLPQDPGPTIALQVSPVGVSQTSVAPTTVVAAPVQVVQDPVVVDAPVIYTHPYRYYPPVTIGFDYWGHRHWR
jgi:uncharacterized protein YcfJ